jgi:hypothetical protein
VTNTAKAKGDRTLCACGCGGAPAKRGAEYIRGHRPPGDLAEYLWRRVERVPSGCWEWRGYIRPAGYGQIGLPGTGKIIDTHRAAWIVTNGPIPDGLFVCHHCDNPPCCRPDHLFLGDAAANSADAVAKGRIKASRATGERAGSSKLTDLQVAEIRRRHIPRVHPARHTGGSSTELAREFGVTRQYIGQLVTNQWRIAG